MIKYKCDICKGEFNSKEYKETKDKSKCILHCKKDTWYKTIKGKKEWDKEKVSFFWIKIRKKITDYKKSENLTSDTPLDLTYTIFPLFEEAKRDKSSTEEKLIWYCNFFENCSQDKENYVLEISINFKKCIFMEKADFKYYTCTNKILFYEVKFMSEINFYKSHFNQVTFSRAEFYSFSLFYDCTLVPLLDKHLNKNQFLNTIFNDAVQFQKVKFGIKDNHEEEYYQLSLSHTKFNDRVHFINCDFFDKLTIESLKNKNNILLDDCHFKSLRISSQLGEFKTIGKGNKKIIENLNISNTQIDKLIINNYIINNRFLFNSIEKINNVNFDELVFNEKVEMKNCNINNLSFHNTKFGQTTDYFGTKFNIINFYKTTFEEVVVFENTLFQNKADFKLTTFSKLGMFKNSTFVKLLNLEDSIIQGEMNFFNVKTNTLTRETARVIKYSFEKIGNKIEANKYHALELEQKRIELKDKKCKSLSEIRDNIVFTIHYWSSSHSTNWFKALCWIFIIGIFTNFISEQVISWNNSFMFISILTNIDEFCGNYVLMSLNKVSLGYLYYQFLMSVRKDTRK